MDEFSLDHLDVEKAVAAVEATSFEEQNRVEEDIVDDDDECSGGACKI